MLIYFIIFICQHTLCFYSVLSIILSWQETLVYRVVLAVVHVLIRVCDAVSRPLVAAWYTNMSRRGARLPAALTARGPLLV